MYTYRSYSLESRRALQGSDFSYNLDSVFKNKIAHVLYVYELNFISQLSLTSCKSPSLNHIHDYMTTAPKDRLQIRFFFCLFKILITEFNV